MEPNRGTVQRQNVPQGEFFKHQKRQVPGGGQKRNTEALSSDELEQTDRDPGGVLPVIAGKHGAGVLFVKIRGKCHLIFGGKGFLPFINGADILRRHIEREDLHRIGQANFMGGGHGVLLPAGGNCALVFPARFGVHAAHIIAENPV